MMHDARGSRLRRDINALIRDPNQNISASKLWVNIGNAVTVYLLIAYGELIVLHWEVLAVLLTILVAPDLLKKVISLKYGETTSTVAESRMVIKETTTTPPKAD